MRTYVLVRARKNMAAAAETLASLSETQTSRNDSADPADLDEDIEIVEPDETMGDEKPRTKQTSRRKEPLRPSTGAASATVTELLAHLDGEKTTEFLRGVIEEYERHMSALALYNKQVSRTINGLKITWTPNKSAGIFTTRAHVMRNINK